MTRFIIYFTENNSDTSSIKHSIFVHSLNIRLLVSGSLCTVIERKSLIFVNSKKSFTRRDGQEFKMSNINISWK